MTLTLKHHLISQIPVLELYSDQTDQKRPLVIMLHGFRATKEHVLPYAYHVVRAGYHAVLFDSPDHGERETSEFKNLSNAEKKAHLYDIVFQTSKDINTIVTAFADHPSVDITRIGLAGFSMGGMIVCDYVSRQRVPGIQAAVSVIGTPEFGKKIRRDITLEPEYASHLAETDISAIESQQPSGRLTKLADFPLLVLNGALDEIISIEDVKAFYRQAKQEYRHKNLIKFVEYPETGHIITPEMLTETISWFGKYL